jgi:Putative DNA-binding domain
MPPLAELQLEFANFLLAPPGQPAPARLPDAIRTLGAPTEERLAVYKNNVYTRLIDALAATYPAVARLVGEEFFRYAATEYIGIHAPRSSTLIGYGDRFADFLGRFAPAASVPYLPDVAELEFKYLEAYHAAEAIAMTTAAFDAALADPDGAPALVLHPSARLMQSTFPVSRIWELNSQPEPPRSKTRIPGETEHLLVIRPRATVEVRRVSRGAHASLARLADGATLTEALTAGKRADPDVDLFKHLAALAAGESFCLREAAR